MSDLLVQPSVPTQQPGRPAPGVGPLVYDSGTPIVGARVVETWSRVATSRDHLRSRAEWADRVIAGLGPGEKALGSLTFASGTDVMHRIVTDRALPARAASTGASTPAYACLEVPSAAAYADRVRTALERIADGAVRKVVLGRCVDVRSTPAPDAGRLVGRLLEQRPGRHVFAVPLSSDLTGGPTLVGASPELLVRRTGRSVVSHPLAGSVPRSADPVEDAARAESLRGSAKDLAEHAYVVDAIVEALTPFCDEVHADPSPGVVSTDTMWHLGSRITAVLSEDAQHLSALHLAQLLHPTPAVGGVPRDAALDLVEELEGDLRGPLAGAVGWVDGAGDGEFAVAIRAAVLHGDRIRLFAGAGIVAGSDPWLEARETGSKLLTMARALGLPVDAVTVDPTEGEAR